MRTFKGLKGEEHVLVYCVRPKTIGKRGDAKEAAAYESDKPGEMYAAIPIPSYFFLLPYQGCFSLKTSKNL